MNLNKHDRAIAARIGVMEVIAYDIHYNIFLYALHM